MIYRYRGSYYTAADAWIIPDKPGCMLQGIEARNYFQLFQKEIQDNEVSVFLAPKLPYWYVGIEMIFSPKRLDKLPDFFGDGDRVFVSQKAKEIIEKVDSFSHQFCPVIIKNKRGDKVVRKYFALHVRRNVDVQVLVDGLNHDDLDFTSNEDELSLIKYINSSDETRSRVEQYPLWQLSGRDNRDIIYMNQSIFDAFLSASISGLKEYTMLNGSSKNKETIGHV